MAAVRMPGQHHRDDDEPQHLEAARAVQERALLDLLRHAAEEAHEQPRAEGDRERRVSQDQRPDRVVDVERSDELREGDEEDRRRDQVRQEDRDADRAVARETEAREAVGGRHGEQERDQHDRRPGQEADLHPAVERRAPQVLVMRERRARHADHSDHVVGMRDLALGDRDLRERAVHGASNLLLADEGDAASGSCSLSLRVVWPRRRCCQRIEPFPRARPGTMMSLWYGLPVVRSCRGEPEGVGLQIVEVRVRLQRRDRAPSRRGRARRPRNGARPAYEAR